MASAANGSANILETLQLLMDEKFSQAYEKAKKALKYGRHKELCLLILGKAAYGMRKWEKSVQRFEQLCVAFPENDDAKEGLRAAQARLTESRTGNFDFVKFYEFAEKGIRDIDVADYVGPIKVADIPGEGKGMVATHDVKKGTLLLVSNAVAVVGNWQSVDAVAHVVAEKLKRVPDIDRLAKICKYNCFGFDGKGGFNGWASKGLWALPSYFNHSCLRNAVHTFYLDVMTVFADADIKKGEEVTLTYANPYDAYKEREELFMKSGFICQCRLCELDRADARYLERENLVKEAIHAHARICALRGPSGGIDLMNQRLTKIRATYEGRPELKTRLHEPLMILANDYGRSTRKDKWTAQIKLFTEYIECVGERLLAHVGYCLYGRLAECYEREGDEGNARKYAHMAVEVLRLRSGCDASVLPLAAKIQHLL